MRAIECCPSCQAAVNRDPPVSVIVASLPEKSTARSVRPGPTDILAAAKARLADVDAQLNQYAALCTERDLLLRMIRAAEPDAN
jgi:hypothetical protein